MYWCEGLHGLHGLLVLLSGTLVMNCIVSLIPLSPNNVLGDNLTGARVNAIYELFLRLIPGFIDVGQTGARKSHGEFRAGARSGSAIS